MATKKVPAKKVVAKKVPAKKVAAPAKKAPAKKVAKPKAEPKLKVGASAKDAATKRGEPYVAILSVELDPDDPGNGAFELDWNDIFLARLVKAGYEGKDDAQIVDRWFQTICRNVIMENFEQWEANQTGERTIVRKDLGNGRTEVS
jgi:hypothetical protein